ncbi:MAG: type 1 glutamine amidotransferase [Eubacteriales bacterium]|nr:type 1 glutamine amidotransferase [Eubacteriales bacterium]
MKKVLVITYDKCDDSELMYPLYRLREADIEPVVCSLEKRVIHAKVFVTAEAVLLPEEVNTDDYVGLYLPGGAAPEKLRQNRDVLRVVREFSAAAKPICAVCHGPQVLISAGLTRGHKCTCYAGIRDDLINSGAEYIDAPVVIDGTLVTSRHPADMPYMMREFIRLLA